MKKLPCLPLFILILLFSCGKNEVEPNVTDPKKAILGKWEIVGNSFGSISYPGSYREFRRDNVVFDYNGGNDFSYSKYSFADSILYIKHLYIDQVSGDTSVVDIEPYLYKFFNYNRLELVMIDPSLNPLRLYQRIK